MATTKHLLATALLLLFAAATVSSIGVNYGTLGDNLPPPTQVAKFLKTQTIIDRIKIYDTNPDIISAFADSGIGVSVTVANGEIPGLTDTRGARRWVDSHIKPFHPQTKIVYVLVGNEVLHWGDATLVSQLVPAMNSLQQALVHADIIDVKVTTAHSLGIMEISQPPSAGRFRPGWDIGILKPILEFCRETDAPFMVNPYPYFGFDPQKMDFAIFQDTSRSYLDKNTNLRYDNMFDVLLDAVYSSMKALGYSDVPIVVGETGWPSLGEPNQIGADAKTAAAFNGNLVKHVNSGTGTPLMPNRKFETYLFALFQENAKPGPTAERNFGLFNPDFSPVYEAGLLRNGRPTWKVESPSKSSPNESNTTTHQSSNITLGAPSPQASNVTPSASSPQASSKKSSGSIPQASNPMSDASSPQASNLTSNASSPRGSNITSSASSNQGSNLIWGCMYPLFLGLHFIFYISKASVPFL